jgi:hypothetical protein
MTSFLKHLVLFSVDTIEKQKNFGPKTPKTRHANVMNPYFLSIEEIEKPLRRPRMAKGSAELRGGRYPNGLRKISSEGHNMRLCLDLAFWFGSR